MKKQWVSLIITVCLLLTATGCANTPYDGYDSVYYGFDDAHILGKTFDEIVDYYGLPNITAVDDSLVGVDDENAYEYIDDNGCIYYTLREDAALRGEESRRLRVRIALDGNHTATAWELIGNTQNNTTGIGLKRYLYDLVWMTGKTAPEIREKYGRFHYEEYRDIAEDSPLINENAVYIIHDGDADIANMDEILLRIYFNKDGVATRFQEQYGYFGG